MFGRATITLSIGPHSSYFLLTYLLLLDGGRDKLRFFRCPFLAGSHPVDFETRRQRAPPRRGTEVHSIHLLSFAIKISASVETTWDGVYII